MESILLLAHTESDGTLGPPGAGGTIIGAGDAQALPGASLGAGLCGAEVQPAADQIVASGISRSWTWRAPTLALHDIPLMRRIRGDLPRDWGDHRSRSTYVARIPCLAGCCGPPEGPSRHPCHTYRCARRPGFCRALVLPSTHGGCARA